MNRFIGIIAAFLFLAALLVHGATYAGVDVLARHPAGWLLHVGAILGFIPAVYSMRSEGRSTSVMEILSDYPRWVRWTIAAAVVYAAVNFVLFLSLTEGGTAEVRNGEFLLLNHGKFIRHLTEAEYHQQQTYVARGFSGHWLLFYLVPALYFLVPRRPMRLSGSSA